MPPETGAFEDYLTRHYAHLGDHARHRARRKRQLLHTWRAVLPADRAAPMLEIGPGYGQLLELLREQGYANAVAVDVSREVVDFCNAAIPGSTALEPDTIAWLGDRPARFERIFAMHVLEHLTKEDGTALVRAIAGALRPGGRFVVEVPNMANLLTAGWLRDADFTHACGYAETSLRQLLEGAGLVDVACFEERVPVDGPKRLLAAAFRTGARLAQRLVYKAYELPVPQVLSPALCATAARPARVP
jgi:2-polyprenyl-3-methyl-5-hydroxy-6-metoxy-1,4-benzoquinol methylase